jgi:hypothetical protein
MPDTPATRKAIAKANGRLARAKQEEDPEAEKRARQELKNAIAEYDK